MSADGCTAISRNDLLMTGWDSTGLLAGVVVLGAGSGEGPDGWIGMSDAK
jgi:hypothetical protein